MANIRHRAADLACRLSRNAPAVCRHYLSSGRRAGRYWLVGNIHNEKGRSLYVRLAPPGSPGKWSDAANGQYGDLLDVIRLSRGLPDLAATLAEAERFLGHSPAAGRNTDRDRAADSQPATSDRTRQARRLFDAAQPLTGTLGETYLARRAIPGAGAWPDLRFLPRAWFDPHTRCPALVAAVRDNAGNLTGITRLFLDPEARLIERRALGRLNGQAVRISNGCQDHAPRRLIAGEGLETVLSFTVTHPGFPLAATLSAGHLAAFTVPASVRQLFIAADNDAVGLSAATRLEERARRAGIQTRIVLPRLGDFNEDLQAVTGDRSGT